MPTTKKTRWNKVGCPFGLGVIILALILLALSACVDVTNYPPATRYSPPAGWEKDFEAMMVCSGKNRPYTINWYISQVPMYDSNGLRQEGRWYENSNDIYLDSAVVDVSSPYSDFYRWRARAHEMLHYLLNTAGHPHQFDDCGVR